MFKLSSVSFRVCTSVLLLTPTQSADRDIDLFYILTSFFCSFPHPCYCLEWVCLCLFIPHWSICSLCTYPQSRKRKNLRQSEVISCSTLCFQHYNSCSCLIKDVGYTTFKYINSHWVLKEIEHCCCQ